MLAQGSIIFIDVKTVSVVCGGVFEVILIIVIAVYLKCRKMK